MARRIFHTLQTLEDARGKIELAYPIQPLGVDNVPLTEALDRALAKDIAAPVDVPAFDRSQMDGFAVRAADTFGSEENNPKRLKIIARIEAGEKPQVTVLPQSAVEIATGAPLPKGADAVVIVEQTEEVDGILHVFKAVPPGANIMPAGSDISSGEVVLRSGAKLSFREIGVLASLGIEKVPVYMRPRVAIISTGNELAPPGGSLEYGRVYDTNTYMLFAALQELGCAPVIVGVVGDKRDELLRRVLDALSSSDLVLTSGSTSAGFGDMIYQIFEEIDPRGLLVHGLAVKPGKPTLAALLKGKLVFGLPGYPASAITIFNQLVKPVLRKMLGQRDTLPEAAINARMAFRVHLDKGRRELFPIHLIEKSPGEYVAYPILKGSGAVTSFSMADGFIDAPETLQFLDEGEVVTVQLFSDRIKPANLVLIGSHCAGVDTLLSILGEEDVSLRAKVVNVGSMMGLESVSKGEADVAGIHLLDESGEYNLPFIEKMKLKNKVHLIRGYDREQGFVSRRDEPQVNSVEDIVDRKLTFINRNPGSGTRILIDTLIKRYSKKSQTDFESIKARITNYNVETKTHSAIASAVKYGRADAGVATRTYAERYGLAFSLITNEKYDFAVPKDRMEKPTVQRFVSALKSKEFKERLEREAPGFSVTEETGKILF